MVDISGFDGSVLIPDNLTESSVVSMFQKLAEDMYTSFRGILKCGNLESRIVLSPAPVVSYLFSQNQSFVFYYH